MQILNLHQEATEGITTGAFISKVEYAAHA